MTEILQIILLSVVLILMFVFLGILLKLDDKRYKEQTEIKNNFLKEIKRYNDIQQSVKEGIFKVNGNFNKRND